MLRLLLDMVFLRFWVAFVFMGPVADFNLLLRGLCSGPLFVLRIY